MDLNVINGNSAVKSGLAYFGLDAGALIGNVTDLQIGRFLLKSLVPTATAAGTAAGTVEYADPRFGVVSTKGYLFVIGIEHYAQIEAGTNETADGWSDLWGSLALRWAAVGGAPQYSPFMESFNGLPGTEYAKTEAAASLANWSSVYPQVRAPSRLAPAWVIDTELDTLSISYGLGGTAPGATVVAVGAVHVCTGFLIPKGALPGRPSLPCGTDPKAFAQIMGQPKTSAAIDRG